MNLRQLISERNRNECKIFVNIVKEIIEKKLLDR